MKTCLLKFDLEFWLKVPENLTDEQTVEIIKLIRLNVSDAIYAQSQKSNLAGPDCTVSEIVLRNVGGMMR